jgi:hypothetical protein
MAPEQAEGRTREVGPATDVYALGGILYAALTGKPPFLGSNPEETRRLVCTTDPVPPSRVRGDCPRGLEGVCLKCLEKRPDQRYRTARELAAALTAWLEGRPPPGVPGRVGRALRAAGITRRRAIAVGVGSALVAGGVFGYRWWADPDRPRRRLEREIEDNLAAGRPVTLIPDTGLPIRFSILNGDEQTTTGLGTDGTFSVSSWSLCLVELLPRVPGGRYRFTVCIRHEKSDVIGAVGAYCAAQTFPGITRPIRLFGGVTYNDVRSAAKELAPNLPLDVAAKVKVPTQNRAKLGTGVVGESGEGALPNWTSGAPFDLAGVFLAWRTLELVVTPAGFSATWNGKEVGSMPSEAANKNPLGIGAEYSPGGGLGLILYRGSASFCSAKIIPLTD